MSTDKAEFELIDSGLFWSCILDLDARSVCEEYNTKCIEFGNVYNHIEMISSSNRDGRDLD